VAKLEAEVEPGEVGFDAQRLARIDSWFRRYVEQGRLAGGTIVVARRGRVAYLSHHGCRDLDSRAPVTGDTLWRIYSMTKPITSVAALLLYERGLLELTDPVARYIPAFADMRVYRSGPASNPGTRPAAEPVRVWHLLTHTAGLTYGFHHAHPVDEMYRAAGYEFGAPPGTDLATACEVWASLPLVHDPGAQWNYSVATDVLGRVVEVVSGRSLADLLAEEIFVPLDMTDTAFWTDELERLATLYVSRPGGGLAPSAMGQAATRRPTFLSGGGGLVSTAADYQRFVQMLARGGELDGVRLLGPRTVAYMTSNHLPGGADLQGFGRPIFSESHVVGVGFGLGVSVVVDAVAGKILTSPGEYAWGGLASTAFHVDPGEAVTATLFTQLMPSSAYPLRSRLRTLINQAIVD